MTFADEGQGHGGGIYRASNWEYVGRARARRAWFTADGRQVAEKSKHSRAVWEMLALGHHRGPVRSKHKFVMHLAPVELPM